MTVRKITKVAGASLVGFVALSLAVDKANVGPMLSQAAGFLGAFAGSLVANRRQPEDPEDPDPPTQD